MPDLPPEVEAQLAQLSDTEWSVLSAKVRAPDVAEQLKSAASAHLSGDRLDSFVKFADASKFTDDSGAVDPGKVNAFMTAVFGTPPASGEQPQWNQHQSEKPGDAGKVAAAQRFGTELNPDVAARTAASPTARGAGGRAALAKRFPKSHGDGRALGVTTETLNKDIQ